MKLSRGYEVDQSGRNCEGNWEGERAEARELLAWGFLECGGIIHEVNTTRVKIGSEFRGRMRSIAEEGKEKNNFFFLL